MATDNTACKTCHPKIYAEYTRSMHARASRAGDDVHRAVWERHPNKRLGNYTCAKCHEPSLAKAESQTHTEPISCRTCHQIKSVERHAEANRNRYLSKKKYFYSVDKAKKGMKVVFEERSRFFGLIKSTTGSPYHDIDYGNEIYYTGEACMGCHAHKQNDRGFTICDLEVIDDPKSPRCLACHMPSMPGALANQKKTPEHAYHGASIHGGTPEHLSQYVELNISTEPKGFSVTIRNRATHTLFPHPLRSAQLRVTVNRNGKKTAMSLRRYRRAIGHDGKTTSPWLADAVIEDTTIKALQTRVERFDFPLRHGDSVDVVFGYYVLDPAAAKALGLSGSEATEFTVLTRRRFEIP